MLQLEKFTFIIQVLPIFVVLAVLYGLLKREHYIIFDWVAVAAKRKRLLIYRGACALVKGAAPRWGAWITFLLGRCRWLQGWGQGRFSNYLTWWAVGRSKLNSVMLQANPYFMCAAGMVKAESSWASWLIGGGLIGVVVWGAYPHVVHLYGAVASVTGAAPGAPIPPGPVVTFNRRLACRSLRGLYKEVESLSVIGKRHVRGYAVRNRVMSGNWLHSKNLLQSLERQGVVQSKDRLFLNWRLAREGQQILELRAQFKSELDGIVGLPNEAILNLPVTPLGDVPLDVYTILPGCDVSVQMGALLLQQLG
jgi:hypothetical protein